MNTSILITKPWRWNPSVLVTWFASSPTPHYPVTTIVIDPHTASQITSQPLGVTYKWPCLPIYPISSQTTFSCSPDAAVLYCIVLTAPKAGPILSCFRPLHMAYLQFRVFSPVCPPGNASCVSSCVSSVPSTAAFSKVLPSDYMNECMQIYIYFR